MTTTYRVHMHTAPGPGATYYDGHVDVRVNRECCVALTDEEKDEIAARAKRMAYAGAMHTGLVVDDIEEL